MPRFALTVSRSSSTEIVFPLYSKEASDASADFVSTVVLVSSAVSFSVSEFVSVAAGSLAGADAASPHPTSEIIMVDASKNVIILFFISLFPPSHVL